MVTQPVFHPVEAPIKELRSGLHPSRMVLGEFKILQNLRWEDGTLAVRGGTVAYLDPPVGSATLIDWWEGELNGTAYIVAAFTVGSKMRLYWSSSGSDWNEATEVGGWFGGTDGDSRFSTLTGRVVFTAIKAPAGYVAGATLPSRDVLLISNGTDHCRVWDPGRTASSTLTITGCANNGSGLIRVTTGTHNLVTGDTVVISGVVGTVEANGSWTVTVITGTTFDLQGSAFATTYSSGGTISRDLRLAIHQKLTLPASASSFAQKATFKRKWQVRGSSGKTYYADAGPPIINDGSATNEFNFANSNYDAYTSTNAVITWTWGTTAAAGQIATVYFASSALVLDKGLILCTEDITAAFGADVMIHNVKIEVNRENVAYNSIAQAWATLWDPSSANEYERRVEFSEILGPDTDPLRGLWFFPADHLATADKTIYHLRVTLLANAPVPSVTAQLAILAICGAGDFPGASEWTLSYEDEPGRSESRRFVANDLGGAELGEIGGPHGYSSSQGAFYLPLNTQIFYDYDLSIPNASGDADIEGGLNGQPSRANLYLRAPNELVATYIYSVVLYAPGTYSGSPFTGRGWNKASALAVIHHNTADMTNTYAFDWTFRDPNRQAPSDFQIHIPPHRASLTANRRTFVGDVLDDASQRQRGDIYFSVWEQPFRMSAIVEDANSGGRTVMDGETVMALLETAAMAQGRSMVLALSNKRLSSMGGSGPFVGSSQDAVELTILQTLADRGTNQPRSAIVGPSGSVFFWDNVGQIGKFAGGQYVPIGRLRTEDKPANVPASRRDDVQAVLWGDIVAWTYTDALDQTTNRRILGWHDVLSVFYFDDLPPQAAERILAVYDSSEDGSGMRLLLGKADGTVYEYDVAGADDLGTNATVRILTGDIPSPEGTTALLIPVVVMEADHQDTTFTWKRIYRNPNCEYQTQLTLDDSDEIGWVTDETEAHTENDAPFDNMGERGKAVQIDGTGQMEPGSRIYGIFVEIDVLDSREARAG